MKAIAFPGRFSSTSSTNSGMSRGIGTLSSAPKMAMILAESSSDLCLNTIGDNFTPAVGLVADSLLQVRFYG